MFYVVSLLQKASLFPFTESEQVSPYPLSGGNRECGVPSNTQDGRGSRVPVNQCLGSRVPTDVGRSTPRNHFRQIHYTPGVRDVLTSLCPGKAPTRTDTPSHLLNGSVTAQEVPKLRLNPSPPTQKTTQGD